MLTLGLWCVCVANPLGQVCQLGVIRVGLDFSELHIPQPPGLSENRACFQLRCRLLDKAGAAVVGMPHMNLSFVTPYCETVDTVGELTSVVLCVRLLRGDIHEDT